MERERGNIHDNDEISSLTPLSTQTHNNLQHALCSISICEMTEHILSLR